MDGVKTGRFNQHLMPWSHQPFCPVPTLKLLEILLRNKCWPTTFHTITAGDANAWCHNWPIWLAQPLIGLYKLMWGYTNCQTSTLHDFALRLYFGRFLTICYYHVSCYRSAHASTMVYNTWSEWCRKNLLQNKKSTKSWFLPWRLHLAYSSQSQHFCFKWKLLLLARYVTLTLSFFQLQKVTAFVVMINIMKVDCQMVLLNFKRRGGFCLLRVVDLC